MQKRYTIYDFVLLIHEKSKYGVTYIYNWYDIDHMQKNFRLTLIELGSGRRAFTSPTTPKMKPVSRVMDGDGNSRSGYVFV